MKRKTIAGLIAVVSVITLVMFAGCVEEEEPTPTPAPKAVAATPTPTFVLTYQDSEFLKWLNETRYTMLSDGGLIVEAIERKDFKNIGIRSGMLSDNATKALNEIDQIGVSPAFEPVKEEFKLELQEYAQVGYYSAMGVVDADCADACMEHLGKVFEHMKRGIELLRQKGLIEEKSPEASTKYLPASTPKTTTQASVKSWHPAAIFTGSNDRTTAPFTIRGDRWRVRYTVDGDYEWGAFYALVYPVGETVMYISSWDCDGGYCYDTQHIYEGNDDYYFKVIAANLDSWELVVEDYY